MIKKWLKGLISLSALALLGRATGFFREILMASKFGASSTTDAYLTTIILFDVAIALNSAIISGTLSYLSTQENSTNSYSRKLIKTSWLFLLITIVLAIILFPLVNWSIPIFFNSKTYQTQVIINSTKILLVLISFSISCGILSSLLQIKGKLSIPGGLTIFVNGFSIISLLFFSNYLGIISIPIGLLLGTVLFFLFQNFLLLKDNEPQENTNFRIIPWLASFLLVFGNLFLPNIATLAERYFALQMNTGTFSHYIYATKLGLLPLTIFGYAVSTSLLPMQINFLQQNDEESFNKISGYGILISVISAGLLITIMHPLANMIIKIVFEHGSFVSKDTLSTASVLRVYSFGLFPFLVLPVLANVFYARHKAALLVAIGITSIVINIILLYLFVKILPDARALAAASAISAWVNFIISFMVLNRKSNFIINLRLLINIVSIIVVTILISFSTKYIFELFYPIKNQLLIGKQSAIFEFVVALIPICIFYLIIILGLIRKTNPEVISIIKEYTKTVFVRNKHMR